MSIQDAFKKAAKKSPELKKTIKIAEGIAETKERWAKEDQRKANIAKVRGAK
jgi:hypothetical protein